MGIFDKFHIQNRKDQFPRRIKELKQATPIAGEVKVPDFIEHVTEQLRNEIDIDPDVYVKNNVKRGLRNANGTGVVVGLTRVGSAAKIFVDHDDLSSGYRFPVDQDIHRL